MKDLVKKGTAFILFDTPVSTEAISSRLSIVHNACKTQFPHWSYSASRKKLIVDFWFGQVFLHYLLIVSVGALALFVFQMNPSNFLASVFVSGTASFILLAFLLYWPIFYADYLAKLDSIIVAQERIVSQVEEIKKCKRTQFSIPALTIIFYVFMKTDDCPMPPVNDHSAALLNNLYGADKDKLKQNLSRLYKFSGLSPKEKAEIQKGIDAARAFFAGINHQKAESLLNQLENKLQQP